MKEITKITKRLLETIKTNGISKVSAEDYKKYVANNNIVNPIFFESITFSDNSYLLFIERVGNKLNIYDSNGKIKFKNNTPYEVYEKLNEALIVYKPSLISFVFNVYYKNCLPIIITIKASDKDNAYDLLQSKLKSIRNEEPYLVELQ